MFSTFELIYLQWTVVCMLFNKTLYCEVVFFVSGVKTEMLTRLIIFVITFFTLSCHLTTTEENQLPHPTPAPHEQVADDDGPPVDAARVTDEPGVTQFTPEEKELIEELENEKPIVDSDGSEQLDTENAEMEDDVQSDVHRRNGELDGVVEDETAEYYEENVAENEPPEADSVADAVDPEFPNPFSNDLLHSPKVNKILRHRPAKDVLETTIIYKPDQYGRVKMEQYIQTKLNGRIILDYQEHYETHPERVTHKDILDAYVKMTEEDTEDPEIIDFGRHPSEGRPVESQESARSRRKGESEDEEDEDEDQLQNKPMTEEEKKGEP